MANICKFHKVECRSADENGNCTVEMVTENGLFITGERWCDSESFFVEHHCERGKELVEEYKKSLSSQSYTALKEQIESFFSKK